MFLSTKADHSLDFLPKNSNWCHFEQFSDHDLENGLVSVAEDEEDEVSSSSSSEGFLWTSATRTQQRRESRASTSPLSSPSSGHTGNEALVGSIHSDHCDHQHNKRFSRSIAGESTTFEDWENQDYAGKEADAHLPRRNNATENGRLRKGSESYQSRSHAARAHYNASIMPNKVIMLRHGQSEGNVNEILYSTTPDNAMRITKLGWEQARKAGEILKAEVIASGEPVHFIVSPYVRTVETFHGIVSAWCDPAEFDYIADRDKRIKAWYGRLLDMGLTWHEDPRIREQDFGNYQVPEKIKEYKRERHRFGPFFYRFPHGESASDVFDRVSTFLDSLWRSFELNRSRNYVLVTHGISIRVLLARYFRYSIDQFNLLANPRNCEMVVLRHDGVGRLQLDGRIQLELGKNEETGEMEVTGYESRKRLRVLPRHFVHKLNVRISYDDVVPGTETTAATEGEP